MDAEQKRVFLAILLSGMVLFVWQVWFSPDTKRVLPPVADSPVGRKGGERVRGSTPLHPTKATPPETKFKKVSVLLQKGVAQSKISNLLTLENMAQGEQRPLLEEISGSSVPFSIELLIDGYPTPLEFDFFKQHSPDYILGHNKSYEIALKVYQESSGKVLLSLNSSKKYRYRISFHSSPKDIGNGRMREFVALKDGSVERSAVGATDGERGNLDWFGIDFNYHLFAFVNSSRAFVQYQTTPAGNMFVDTTGPSTSFNGYLIFSKKNYDHLMALGDNLKLAVDFGFFGILALPILRGLQFFYQFIANYGVSIIIVTLIIRMITFPLQFFSFRSMKRMQKIQPQLSAIRGRYKEDPKKMQEETMKLFRQSKVNPLGGCFPMLLQMPIFFAFYQVLYSAVELVDAPFCLWIVDLSIKDPYYVLPVFMMATMFLQSKFTPSMSSVDSTQRKIMYILPVVFGFFMKDLPAGLNLYFTVSMIFGMLQQFLVYRITKDPDFVGDED